MIYDYAIVGAGVFGLTLARRLAQSGRSVILFDQNEVGQSGASAGLLGALMPASPLAGGPLPTVQLRCLSRYADRIAALEAESGCVTGYRRHGRVQPLLTEQAHASFTVQAAASSERWRELAASLRVIGRAALADLHPALASELTDTPLGSFGGYAFDDLTAQVQPRQLLAALVAAIDGKVALQPHTRVLQIGGTSIVTEGATFQARQAIVTAGWQSGGLTGATVQGVKGQACAVAPLLSAAPLLYARDCYAVFHAGATALGSTTEKQWNDPAPDLATCTLLRDRAAALLPVLADRAIHECWAGIRPRTTGALPLVRRVSETTLAATGGYKIGLALAFEIAEWLGGALAETAEENFWKFVAAKENLPLDGYA